MPPRKAPSSRGSAKASDSAIASTSASTVTADKASQGEGGGAANTLTEERTGDDQQISQILAEMAHQTSASSTRVRASRAKYTAADFAQVHSPSIFPESYSSSESTSDCSSTTLTRRTNSSASASPALSPGPQSMPALPNVSTSESGVISARAVEPTTSTAVSPSNDEVSAPAADGAPTGEVDAAVTQEEAENDELANSGEGDDAGTSESGKGAKGRSRAKNAEKRARGNGDEHKKMTEEEWDASRKANHKEVERRRRETINAGLDSLAALLPPPPPPPPGVPVFARNAKPNKSEILGRGIDYIKALKKAQLADANKWTLEKLLKDQEIKKGQQDVEQLKEENEALKKRIAELEGAGQEKDEGDRDNKKRRIGDGPL